MFMHEHEHVSMFMAMQQPTHPGLECAARHAKSVCLSAADTSSHSLVTACWGGCSLVACTTFACSSRSVLTPHCGVTPCHTLSHFVRLHPLLCCVQVPFIAGLVDLPLVSSLLQGFLPSLVLLVFLAVAPYLLKALIQGAGLASMTAIDAQLIGMYFLFQLVSDRTCTAAGCVLRCFLPLCVQRQVVLVLLPPPLSSCCVPLTPCLSVLHRHHCHHRHQRHHGFNQFAVFIFSFISGTALSQLQGLIDDPHRIVSLLGVSAPQQASFFCTWTLLLVRSGSGSC